MVAPKKTPPKRSTAKRSTPKRSAAKGAKAKTQAKTTAKRTPPVVAKGMRLVQVFGPFGCRALVEMSADRALALFEQPLTSTLSPTRVIDATLGEIETLAKRSPGLDKSPIAATAVALAYEIDSPFNSATSKSLCAKQLRDTIEQLQALAPEQAKDRLDELGQKRAARQQQVAAR